MAASRVLREELAGRARKRVLAEYTLAERALEWADVFKWALSHGGSGRAASSGRTSAAGAVTHTS
jgi:hypothetical protein